MIITHFNSGAVSCFKKCLFTKISLPQRCTKAWLLCSPCVKTHTAHCNA